MSDNLFKTLDRELSIRSIDNDNKSIEDTNKIKFINLDKQNFKEFYSTGNKMYQNYNLDTENDLTYGINSRRQSVPKDIIKQKTIPKQSNTKQSNIKQDLNIMDIIDASSNIKLGNEYTKINLNTFSKNAAKTPKTPKESETYWDNTRRRNLDTSVYTDNPSKIAGRGFGDIPKYDLFLNGIGLSTRQDNPDIKPQNIDDDRIFLTSQNYNYAKFHVTDDLQCGADTRYLNKKMIN